MLIPLIPDRRNIALRLSGLSLLVLPLLLLLLTDTSAFAQTDGVSNIDENSNSSHNVVGFAFAQSFTTGDVPRRLAKILSLIHI